MDKRLLEQLEAIMQEIEYLDKKISKNTIKVVGDSVQGSSKEYPYVRHHFKIEGFENPRYRRKYVNMLESYKNKLEKTLIQLEYEIENIQDSDIRTIIRYRYYDRLTYNQIAHRMNKTGIYTEDSIRMKLKRFLEG